MNVQSPEDVLREYGEIYSASSIADVLGPEPPPFSDMDERMAATRKTQKREAEEPEPMRIIDPCSLQGLIVPERQWIVQDWLPVGYTTALYGDGGTGKTLLAQQLMTSCTTGCPWLGLAVQRCKVLGLFCEDDEDEGSQKAL